MRRRPCWQRATIDRHVKASSLQEICILDPLTIVPTFLKFVSVLSFSGTLSIPLGSTPNLVTVRCMRAYRVSPVMKTSPGTAGASSAYTGRGPFSESGEWPSTAYSSLRPIIAGGSRRRRLLVGRVTYYLWWVRYQD